VARNSGKARPDYGTKILPYDEAPNYEEFHPTFCLQHIQSGFGVKQPNMTKDQKASFAGVLESLASLTWSDIKRSGRHQLGFEMLPVSKLKIAMPAIVADDEKVMVFRYHDRHPMAGVRRGAMLHLIALEREFGDLYDH
jgi:hypothetical protein